MKIRRGVPEVRVCYRYIISIRMLHCQIYKVLLLLFTYNNTRREYAKSIKFNGEPISAMRCAGDAVIRASNSIKSL